MVKKSKLVSTLCLLGFSFAFVGCAACGTKDDNKKSTALPAPELIATDDGIHWASIANAKKYRVKLGDESWKDYALDDCKADYPVAVGDYTLSVAAVDANGKTGNAAEFNFSVKQEGAAHTQNGNTLSFTGENVWYSVNGEAEAELGDDGVLDFTAAAVGSKYSVSYYTKGGFWSQEESAYYVDGAKQSVELTVTTMLSAPVLGVSADGSSLVWTADANALNYEVTIDGVTTTVSASSPSVAFPTTVGEHTISVKAAANGAWTASRESEYVMTTAPSVVPEVTYDPESNNVVWSNAFLGAMQSSENGGEYTTLATTSATYSETMTLKVKQRFDEATKTLWLESKTLSFATRALPSIAFEQEGNLLWNQTDEGVEKTYFVSLEEEGESFEPSAANRLNVSDKAAGSYVFKVYAGQYMDEGKHSAILYLPSPVATLNFGVLESPVLDFETGKLLWTVDENATGYEYKIDDGEWTAATEEGFAEVTNLATYSVRVIGNETAGSLYVGYQTASVRFDPSLTTDSLGYLTVASFDKTGYSTQIGAPMQTSNMTSTGKGEIVTTGADAEEQAILDGATGKSALKITAGSAGGRNSNLWGNSDGVSVELFKGIVPSAEGQIVIRLYMKSNADRKTAWEMKDQTNPDTGVTEKKETPVDLEGRIIVSAVGPSKVKKGSLYAYEIWPSPIATDQWVEYTIALNDARLMGGKDKWGTEMEGVTEVKYLNIMFQNNGKEGDVIYVDSVTYAATSPKVTTLNVDFDKNPEFIKTFSQQGKTSLVTDTVNGVEKNVAKVTSLWRYDGTWAINYADKTLSAGTKISVTMKVVSTSDNGGGININGSWKKDFDNSSEWKTYDVTLNAETVLTSISFNVYNPSHGYDIYLAGIEIDAPAVITDYKNIDFTTLGGVTGNVSAYHGNNATGGYTASVSYDATEQAVKVSGFRIYGGGATGKGLFVGYPASGQANAITIVEGMKISVVVKAEYVQSATSETKFTWFVNGSSNSSDGSWLGEASAIESGVSKGWVTLEWTCKSTSTLIGKNLDNVYVRTYDTNNSQNIYLKSVTITFPEA